MIIEGVLVKWIIIMVEEGGMGDIITMINQIMNTARDHWGVVKSRQIPTANPRTCRNPRRAIREMRGRYIAMIKLPEL